MNYDTIIPCLAALIVLLFLLFSAFLQSVSTEKKLSNQLLVAFLILVSLDISAFYSKIIEL
jgi:hypothetical protein